MPWRPRRTLRETPSTRSAPVRHARSAPRPWPVGPSPRSPAADPRPDRRCFAVGRNAAPGLIADGTLFIPRASAPRRLRHRPATVPPCRHCQHQFQLLTSSTVPRPRRGPRRARRARTDAPPRRPRARRLGRHRVLPLAQHPLRPLLDPQARRRPIEPNRREQQSKTQNENC